MASMKSEKPVGTPMLGQAKKEPAKAVDSAPKAADSAPKAPVFKPTAAVSKPVAPVSKPALKKAELKPQEPKKAKGGKPAAKN